MGLGHLDGDGLELIQKLRAAKGLSADTQAAQHLRLVPHADLPQLDARDMEMAVLLLSNTPTPILFVPFVCHALSLSLIHI